MSECQHYKCRPSQVHSKIIQNDRNPRKPITHEICECFHPDSPKLPGTLTSQVHCGGDPKNENCIMSKQQ